MASSITRREFLKASAAGSLMMASPVRSAVAPKAFDYPKVGKYQVYFGDLHNHSEVGYARGSLDRAFEIAAEHLDFFAFTPHGYWHDISTYENNIENKWLNGFEVTKKRWPEVLAAVRKYDREPGFVPMAGFEWHSTSLGDYHIIFPTLDAEYVRFDSLREFQRFAKERRAILIPH
ncbi:MAG: twin-arginine translocation signal domain-containing protein, partial [Planctomycetota bacterium]